MLCFSFTGVRIDITLPSPDGPLSQFLRTYFLPFFAIDDQPLGGSVARLELNTGSAPIDPVRFAGLAFQDIDRSKAFLHCTGQIFDEMAVRWVRLSPSDAIVRIERARASIAVWGADEHRLRVPALRIIEDLVLNEVQRQGGVVVHASALVTNAGAVLFVGNKGAGKTSSLCRGLTIFEADKLANDNVVLWRRGERILAHGWPAFFKVEVGTVAATDALVRDFPPEHRPLLPDDRALWDIYWKVTLYPGQGAARFGACITPEATVAAIVFPQFSEHDSPGLQPVPIETAHDLLKQALQGVHNPNHSEWIGLNPVPRDQPADELARLLPALADVSLHALTWALSLDDLLSRIPALRGARRTLLACATGRPPEDGWPPLPLHN